MNRITFPFRKNKKERYQTITEPFSIFVQIFETKPVNNSLFFYELIDGL